MKKRNKRKKENMLRRNMKESCLYIGESKNFIWLAIGIFVFFAFIAIIFPTPEILETVINQKIQELIEMTKGLDAYEMILFIFQNNAGISFIALFLGIMLGIVPIFLTLSNGYVLGYVMKLVIIETGFNELWRLLPHGIFEIPAVIISLALGIRLGVFPFAKKPLKEFKKRIISSLKVFFLIILPLLIIAAVIEGLLIALI